MSQRLFSGRTARLFLIFLLLSSGVLPASAANLKLEAKLIWATDDHKSPKKEHTPVDEATATRLRKVFKWKYYFVENTVTNTVPSRGSNNFKLSPKCAIEITELEGPRVEVKLIGNGKPVHKTIKQLGPGEPIIYSGDDKNENAWIVVVTQLEVK